MKLVRPEDITPAGLISSDVPEDEPVYSAATTYAVDAVVRGAGDDAHTTFISLKAGNVGHPLREPASLWWLEAGPTNRWKMFDAAVQSQTSSPDQITVVRRMVGRVDTLALLNISAARGRVTMTDDIDGVVFDQAFDLVSPSGITDWYAYFNEPIVRITDFIIDLPAYSGALLEVTLEDPGQVVAWGVMIAGQSRRLGDTQWGATLGIIDYSVVQPDAFGNIRPIKRAYSRRASFSVWVDSGFVDELINILAGYRATPILFIGSPDYAATAVYGIVGEFNVEISYPTRSQCTIDLKGLT